MSDKEPSRATEFLAVRQQLEELLSHLEFGKSFSGLADAYDLSAAKDELERFVNSGSSSDFNVAAKRISAVAARSAIKNRDEIGRVLLKLSDIAANLTQTDFRSFTEVKQSGSPDSNTSVNRTDAVDVLVVAAMYEPELTALLPRIAPFQDFVGTAKSGLPDITYFVGSISRSGPPGTSPVSVAALFLTRTGLTDCASIVASGLRVFRPQLIAMTGVCAGRRAMGVQKNDIIVPSSSFTFDSGKYSEADFQREPHWGEASTRVIQRVRTVGNAVLDEVVGQITSSLPARIRRPNLHYDIMACGSSVVDRDGMIDQIAKDSHRKVAGLDMESYAFLRSSILTDPTIPRIVVKGVMDYSTGKSDRVKAQAAFWAAAFLSGLIKMDFNQLVGRSRAD